MLNQLHRHFKHPLKNALDYYLLKQMALKDHLTGLGNRANYQETIQRFISQAKRTNQSFGVLVIDMDRFKYINDTFGHQEGDQVLMAVADTLRQAIRDTDFAFRFGGDEFCCLLGNTDQSVNAKIANRIHTLMRDNKILNRHGVSCSIGGAIFRPQDDASSLFQRADNALYTVKRNGKGAYQAA